VSLGDVPQAADLIQQAFEIKWCYIELAEANKRSRLTLRDKSVSKLGPLPAGASTSLVVWCTVAPAHTCAADLGEELASWILPSVRPGPYYSSRGVPTIVLRGLQDRGKPGLVIRP
jgi:hypothetical protein